jgi:hypothetical protein
LRLMVSARACEYPLQRGLRGVYGSFLRGAEFICSRLGAGQGIDCLRLNRPARVIPYGPKTGGLGKAPIAADHAEMDKGEFPTILR